MRPDLVLLDLMLPEMEGLQVCRLLKFDRRFSHIPIVVLTSRDLEETAELAKKNGADSFIVKTTPSEVILDVIKRLLDKETALNALRANLDGDGITETKL